MCKKQLNNKIQLTYRLVCQFVSELRMPVSTGSDELNILCLEGSRPLSELDGLVGINSNAPDRYNDCVICFWRNPQGKHLRVLRASTQPGLYYTVLHPHLLGAANLVWGEHLYKQGKHRGHKALVSATGFDRVWRDRDGNFSQDLTEKLHVGRFGIHVHAGGKGERINRWSAGCIVIHGGYDGGPYLFLLDRIAKHPSKIIHLTLWGGRDFSRWSSSPASWRPILRYGIRNPWVAEMQNLLNVSSNAHLVCDGDWGSGTQASFLAFQA